MQNDRFRLSKEEIGADLTILSSLLHRKSRFHPPLLAPGIMRHVGVTHGRQFTGGVFAGVSMRARAVGDDLSIIVRQQLRSEFFDLFGRDIQRSGKVGFAVAFRRKRRYDLDGVFSVQLGLQVFCRNRAFRSDLLADAVFDAPAKRLAPRKLIFGSVAYGSPALRGPLISTEILGTGTFAPASLSPARNFVVSRAGKV
jgi:hypothetical protein